MKLLRVTHLGSPAEQALKVRPPSARVCVSTCCPRLPPSYGVPSPLLWTSPLGLRSLGDSCLVLTPREIAYVRSGHTSLLPDMWDFFPSGTHFLYLEG